ncbi:Nitrogen metabolite regulation [Hyphodiscus hymeniophilus]|uniref:Nitrogen metabolite regulation n=1 Tax=Hyphodiscus hymeniophilus TaxID=353542 RepID=A0A9P6VFF5_9HELO|nr:Nitrogen metabolite regulation [Hyphodiscus hymeniophilus]
MSQILAVFGATGQQGRSVINFVLNDTELSQKYHIRAITRDINSEQAKKLKKTVELVQADMLDQSSIDSALTGVHTVFVMTTPSFGPDAVEIEYNCAKTVADAAVEKGAKFIIFSTLPSASETSGGRYTQITPFEAKAKAEKYIRGLPIKSAFFAGGYFMENLQSQPFLAPQKAPDGTWILARPVLAETKSPYIDAVGDIGKVIGAILAEPDKYEGKTFCAAVALYSFEEIAAILTKTTGKTVVYKQVPLEDFKKGLESILPPPLVAIFVEGFEYQEEFGYFGPDSEKLVAWAAENARGRLSTLQEYLESHPLQLV